MINYFNSQHNGHDLGARLTRCTGTRALSDRQLAVLIIYQITTIDPLVICHNSSIHFGRVMFFFWAVPSDDKTTDFSGQLFHWLAHSDWVQNRTRMLKLRDRSRSHLAVKTRSSADQPIFHMGGSIVMGIPQNGSFIIENPEILTFTGPMGHRFHRFHRFMQCQLKVLEAGTKLTFC